MKRYFFLTLQLILMLVSFAPAVFAGEYSISPAKSAYDPANSESRFGYYLSADPAEVLESAVTLKNLGNQKINVRLIPVDAFHDDKGAFILASPNAKQIGIGSWISLDEQAFVLNPKQSLDVPFKINLPGQLAPGTYFGGLMIGETSEDAGMTESGVEVKSFVGVKIFLDVSGEEVVKFDWKKFGHTVENDASVFQYKFSNDGNVMLKANIDLTVKDLFGKEVFAFQTAEDAFPGKETEYSVRWEDMPPLGFFKANSMVAYSKTDIFGKAASDAAPVELEKSKTFYVLPILYTAIALGLIALLIIVLVWRAVRMKNFKRQLREYKVKKGDTLFELAQKGNTDWKKLAKVNKIKAPYVIFAGQTILIKSSK